MLLPRLSFPCRFFGATLALSALPFQSWSVQAETIRLNDVMTRAEQQQTGISKLSRNERANLEQWISNYTLRLYSNLARNPGLRPGEIPLSGKTQREQNRDYKPHGQVLELDEVYEEGVMIRLADGSVWHVNDELSSSSFRWEPGSRIAIYRSRDPLFPYRLVNMNSRDAVDAKLDFGPSIGEKTQESSKGSGERVIQKNSSQGSEIIMEDGSSWQISPWDKFKTKLWLPGEKVQVERSGGVLYPYRLTNVESEERVEAKLMRTSRQGGGSSDTEGEP